MSLETEKAAAAGGLEHGAPAAVRCDTNALLSLMMEMRQMMREQASILSNLNRRVDELCVKVDALYAGRGEQPAGAPLQSEAVGGAACGLEGREHSSGGAMGRDGPCDDVPRALSARATEELQRLCCEKDGRVDLNDLRRCVLAGADVMWRVGDEWNRPLMQWFLTIGNDAAVRVCLKSPCAMDFRVANTGGSTLLHSIAVSEYLIASLLPLVVARVEGEHGPDSAAADTVDWGQKDVDGDDCLSMAASAGTLSAFWRVVSSRDVGHFTRCEGKIRVTQPVKRADFSLLSAEDRERFDLLGGFEEI